MGIRGGVSRQEEGWLHPPPNWATRSYLRKTMSSTAYFLTRHTSKERVTSLREFMSFLSVESRTWTSAHRMVCSYVKCPSITSPPSDRDHHADDGERHGLPRQLLHGGGAPLR